MRIVRTIAAMQRLARSWRRSQTKVALVPTMGYLHDGHLSLVKKARSLVGRKGFVAVSIYVNPAQFGPNEDLSKYPRDFARDQMLCRNGGVDVIFAPVDSEIYPADFSTCVVEEKLSQSMEGASRPAHFRGVTTVVAKLFNLVQPEVAVFGAKDFQQASVIQRMVADLNFSVKIVVAPTHREADGLAMSSRNRYLTPAQRSQAPVLYEALQRAKKTVGRGKFPSAKLKLQLQEFIGRQSGARLDYIEFFDPKSLQPVSEAGRGTQMALAVFFGKTRLIDNARL